MRPVTLTVISVLLCGCAADRSAIKAPTEAWSLTETLRIGSPDGGEYPLQRVSHLLPSAEGGVLVLQASSTELPEFGSTGSLRNVIGRRGSGPGEFRHVSAFGWLQDTLWVADLALRRISFFAADGSHSSDLPVSMEPIGDWHADHDTLDATFLLPTSRVAPSVIDERARTQSERIGGTVPIRSQPA